MVHEADSHLFQSLSSCSQPPAAGRVLHLPHCTDILTRRSAVTDKGSTERHRGQSSAHRRASSGIHVSVHSCIYSFNDCPSRASEARPRSDPGPQK